MESNSNILLGTVGYHLLGNHSIAPILYDNIQSQKWAAGLDVQEMNWGPIAIVQYLESKPSQYKRIVFFTAIERKHREIGDFTIYRWGGRLPSVEDVQACVGDAVTGVISAENLLIIGEHFKVWPEEVFLFDVEPGPEKAGITLSVEVGEMVQDYFSVLDLLCNQGVSKAQKIENLYGDEIMAANALAKLNKSD